MGNIIYPDNDNFTDDFAINRAQFNELSMTKARAGRSARQKSEDMGADRKLDHVIKEDMTTHRGEHL